MFFVLFANGFLVSEVVCCCLCSHAAQGHTMSACSLFVAESVYDNMCCTYAGDRLRPSEVVRTLTMRLRNLEAALSKASHHMQVVFVVTAAVEKSLVEQVMGRSTRVECRERSSAPAHETHVFTVQNLHC